MPPLNDTIIVALGQLVDDAQTERRDPSHSELEFQIKRAGLAAGDPKSQGQTVGKAKRVSFTLSWALEHDFQAGGKLVLALLSLVRGHGGFRKQSANYVGNEAIQNAISAFDSEGYQLSFDGELQPKLLDSLSGRELTQAIQAYVRRAKKGSVDAALITGTSKDLLEAIAAHILRERFGSYSHTSNFPTLLGQAFSALNLATPQTPEKKSEPPRCRIERGMYELACGVNRLRNKQGTGHGRPWLPSISDQEARSATECMGVIAEYLLFRHAEK